MIYVARPRARSLNSDDWSRFWALDDAIESFFGFLTWFFGPKGISAANALEVPGICGETPNGIGDFTRIRSMLVESGVHNGSLTFRPSVA
jgi:hypothetical protein